MQGGSNPRDDQKTWIAAAPLDRPEIGKINSGLEGELLLRQSALQANTPHIAAKHSPPIHRQDGAGSGL